MAFKSRSTISAFARALHRSGSSSPVSRRKAEGFRGPVLRRVAPFSPVWPPGGQTGGRAGTTAVAFARLARALPFFPSIGPAPRRNP